MASTVSACRCRWNGAVSLSNRRLSGECRLKPMEQRSTSKSEEVLMRVLTALLIYAAALAVGTGMSYASDMADVKAVVDAYHGALSALDAPKMEAMWVHDDSVMDIEPSDKSISVGWDAVKKNLVAEFNSLAELKVTQAEGPHIQVKGDVAWSTG